MGKLSEANVYAAELKGILLALVIILRRKIQHVAIFTDNQAEAREPPQTVQEVDSKSYESAEQTAKVQGSPPERQSYLAELSP